MRERIGREAAAVGLLLAAVLMLLALASHSPLDPSPFHVSTARERPENMAGPLGAAVSAGLLGLLGWSAVLLPPLAGALGWRLLRQQPIASPRLLTAGWTLLLVAVPGFAHLACTDVVFRGGTISCGGLIGRAACELSVGLGGPAGRLAILIFLLLLGVLMVTGASAGDGVERLLAWARGRLDARGRRRREQERERAQEKARQRVLERQMERLDEAADGEYRGSVTVKELEGHGKFRIVRRVVDDTGAEMEPESAIEVAPEAPSRRRATSSARRSEPSALQPAPVVQEEFDFVEDLDAYDLPRTSFLDPPEEAPQRDSAAFMEIAALITAKCQEFKVRGEVVNIRTGPVITTYEFRLDSGVKISAVQNLSEDLALALKAESVRIERIPGRATVGLEVPSPLPEVIRLRPLVEAGEFQRASSLLTLCLGVDIHGKPVFTDLARMPHLLIGGFTGSGKSVGINGMIMSILYKARPDQVRLIFVDPKMVELGVYADIPHLLTPIITDPKKAANALGWAVAEMDIRYRRLAALGVRNLNQYNQLVADPVQVRRVREQLSGEIDDDDLERLEPLPFLVIVIDELADLMMTSSRAVEESITRLAQKARAVGVHLICATQRPSVDILTGIIKANFPCRIAYKVRSKFDSRTILDVMGAEHLLGRGDMLYLAPGSSALTRLHGPLVTEREIAVVVRYIKRFGKPTYRQEIVSHEPLGLSERGGRRGGGPVEDQDELTDPMYDQAARLVVRTRKASASYVQRRLHLGYTRSARLLDMMEREGLVGALNGSKGREVLVPPDFYQEVDDTLGRNADDDNEEEDR